MRYRAKARWLVIALIVLLVAVAVAGCGSREAEEPEDTGPLLPRLTVSFDESGTPKVFGISLGSVGRLLNQDMSAYYLPEETVAQLMAGDIQHAEVVLTKDGLFLYGNGEPLPYLATDEESLQTLVNLVEENQLPGGGAIKFVLEQIVPRFGLPIVLKFPVAEGNEEIDLREARVLLPVVIEDARAGVSERSIVAYVDVQFDENGMPTIAGAPVSEFESALADAGMSVSLGGVRLDPAMLASLKGFNVQHLQVETEPEGMYLYLNGRRLPRIAWDEERLSNALDLYSRLDPDSPYLPVVSFVLPYVQPADVELTLIFPPQGEGAGEVPFPFIRPQ